MFLAVTIGNSNIRIGVFKDSKLVLHNLLPAYPEKTEDQLIQFLKQKEVSEVAIASVVPSYNKIFKRVVSKLYRKDPLFISTNLTTGISIKIENPLALGADILANVVAACALHKGSCIVIDFGTATTINAINTKGEYIGTAIAPGVSMIHDSLIDKTALLQRVDLKLPFSPIGTNTITAIQSGVLFGYIGLVEGLIKRFKKILGKDVYVIATGGAAGLVAPYIKEISETDSHLTLKGTQFIWERNK